MLSNDFNILLLFIVSLLAIVFTDCAAANDAINNANSLFNPFFKHRAITESIASPAPTLSTEVFAYASQAINFLSLFDFSISIAFSRDIPLAIRSDAYHIPFYRLLQLRNDLLLGLRERILIVQKIHSS